MYRFITLLENDFCVNLLSALLHSIWQGLVIAALLIFHLRTRPAKNANSRYTASVIALAAIVLCGLFTWAILNYKPASKDTALAAPTSPPEATTVITSSNSHEQRNFTDITTKASENTPAGSVKSNWRPVVMSLWLIGVVAMLSRSVYIIVGGTKLQRQCKPLEDEYILNLVEKLRKTLGIARRIRVAAGEHILIPGVVGFIRPILLLPASMVSGVPADDLQAILAHELAHIRRYDYLVNFCQMVVEAILFFNPAVWWISRQIRIEREACCDNAGIIATGQRIRYAEVLTGWAQKLKDTNLKFAAAIGFSKPDESSNLLERVRRIVVTEHRPHLKVSWNIAAITLLLSFAVLLGLWGTTTMTVALAGKLLTPQQRIDKIKEIAETHNPQSPEYGPEDKLHLSGTVRTPDGSELPDDTRFVVEAYNENHSSGIHLGRPRDGRFSTSVNYYENVLFIVTASGYAPLISKPYHFQPGETVSDIELVFDKGFTSKVKFVNKEGKPIPGTKLKGLYFLPQKNGWSGLQSINEVVSGEDGIAVLEHCIERTAKFDARAEGYQEDVSKDIALKPGETFVWELAETEPATGVVVSRQTGEPIENAKFHLCYKNKPGHGWSFGGNSRIIMGTTDKQGRFALETLNKEWEYTFIVDANNYNRTPIKGVNMGDRDLRVEMGPELHLHGKILGDINMLETMSRKPIIRWESRYSDDYEGVRDYGWENVEVINGEGQFTLRNILGKQIEITAGNKTRQIKIENKSIDDFVMDLKSPFAGSNKDFRDVVLEFEIPEGSPVPEGEIRINTNPKEDNANGIRGTSKMYPIKDGKIYLEVPVPGYLSYGLNWSQGQRIAGYWIDRTSKIEIPAGDEPYKISIPTHPAGAIYGQVLEADKTLAKDIKLHLIVLKKSPAAERAFFSEVFGHEENESGKFSAAPLPFGGEYAIVAYRDSTWVASEPVKLNEENPIQQIELKFAKGLKISGQITDPNGKPFVGANVGLMASVRYDGYENSQNWATSAGQIKTTEDGSFAFENINPKLPGKYTLHIDAGAGYQRVQMEAAANGRPINIKLQKGYNLSGILLDDKTGWPIPDAFVYAEAVRKNGEVGDNATTDSKTDDNGRFSFSTMDKRQYRLYLGSASIVNTKGLNRPSIVVGGQQEQVTLRVNIYEWSDLKPRKPD
ncbi:MAG: carboxypeptidase regulatory-like domain-containing protein [Sedimentisphaerales bacterium]|nr:carboxypeptidase regulatory-like domain-containing protein [Sedimentisphaerales bacterium]